MEAKAYLWNYSFPYFFSLSHIFFSSFHPLIQWTTLLDSIINPNNQIYFFSFSFSFPLKSLKRCLYGCFLVLKFIHLEISCSCVIKIRLEKRFTIYKVNKASKKKREKSSAKKERKATKTLAIVLGMYERNITFTREKCKEKTCQGKKLYFV